MGTPSSKQGLVAKNLCEKFKKPKPFRQITPRVDEHKPQTHLLERKEDLN